MFKAALYDLDGLIVDSEPLHGLASEKALHLYGRALEDIPLAVRRSFYGKRVVDVAAEVVDSLDLPVKPERWAEERQEIFMGLIEEGVGLMPGMMESLAFFAQNGMKKAVVSSGDKRYVERILQLTGLENSFDAVVTGNDVTRGKPDPQCYLLGAQKLKVMPSSCLVLEDAYAGIKAALAAGMKVIGIENQFNSRFDGAHIVLQSLAAIDGKVLEMLESRHFRGR